MGKDQRDMAFRIVCHPLLQVVLQCEVLRYKHRLAILLDHVEVIGGIHAALKQDTDHKRLQHEEG